MEKRPAQILPPTAAVLVVALSLLDNVATDQMDQSAMALAAAATAAAAGKKPLRTSAKTWQGLAAGEIAGRPCPGVVEGTTLPWVSVKSLSDSFLNCFGIYGEVVSFCLLVKIRLSL